MREGKWGTGGHEPGLVLIVREADLDRVGNCWMKGRLREGDIIICMHAGDCFWDYALLEHSFNAQSRDQYRIILESRFGAYVLGTPTPWQPNHTQFSLMMTGARVPAMPQEISEVMES